MTPHWSRTLSATPLHQPDRFSCGAAVAVVSQALSDHSAAETLLAQARLDLGAAFGTQVLAMHRVLTSSRDARGAHQIGWPSGLGTPPWTLARHLAISTGQRHDVIWARWARHRALTRIAHALEAGHPVPLYLGNTRLPRHVVLVLPPAFAPTTATHWMVYEPAYGVARQIRATEFVGARITECAWPVPWFAVVPHTSAALPRAAEQVSPVRR